MIGAMDRPFLQAKGNGRSFVVSCVEEKSRVLKGLTVFSSFLFFLLFIIYNF